MSVSPEPHIITFVKNRLDEDYTRETHVLKILMFQVDI